MSNQGLLAVDRTFAQFHWDLWGICGPGELLGRCCRRRKLLARMYWRTEGSGTRRFGRGMPAVLPGLPTLRVAGCAEAIPAGVVEPGQVHDASPADRRKRCRRMPTTRQFMRENTVLVLQRSSTPAPPSTMPHH